MRKAVLTGALAALALVQASLYWNVHLSNAAGNGALKPQDRVELLERAASFDPWNDATRFDLGLALLEIGSESLDRPEVRDAALQGAAANFMMALRLNPGSAAVHFQLAQTLRQMGYLGLPAGIPYFDEYKKAAALTGHNSQIFFEVGRVLLSRWESLAPDEKAFALDILEKTLAGRDDGKLASLLEVWYLHGHDYSIMDRILPGDPGAYRGYARFLGEKSLSLDIRLRALAKAEFLDFGRALSELDRARRDFGYFQGEDLTARLSSCLKLLKGIRFYQSLSGQALIDPGDYARAVKTAYLLLAQNRIDTTRSLEDPEGYAETYVALETEPLAVGEFEQFIRERGLFEEEGDDSRRSRDLKLLAFRLEMDFKQNRYKDITRAAGLIQDSTIVVSEKGRPYYVRVLQLMGDSFLKLDYMYEAERYYRRALDAEPGNVATLGRIEKCYDRLNDDRQAAEVKKILAALLTPQELDLGRRLVPKGHAYPVALTCEGGSEVFHVELEAGPENRPPLVSAVFNDRVVWEGYAPEGGLSFRAEPRTGGNLLVLSAINEPVTLLRVSRALPPPD